MLHAIKSELIANNNGVELRFAWVDFLAVTDSNGCHSIRSVLALKNLCPSVGIAA